MTSIEISDILVEPLPSGICEDIAFEGVISFCVSLDFSIYLNNTPIITINIRTPSQRNLLILFPLFKILRVTL